MKKVFNDTEDIFEEVFDDGEDIFVLKLFSEQIFVSKRFVEIKERSLLVIKVKEVK